MEVQYWYVQMAVNNLNARVYKDLIEDMRVQGNGVFQCTMKLNDAVICDYINITKDDYVEPVPAKTNQIPRR